jgi:aspartyl-tRNA synthetase
VFTEFAAGKPVTPYPFPKISYGASIRGFGTDKPDLRNPLIIHDVTKVFRRSKFRIFSDMISKDPRAKVWAVPAIGNCNRKFCDRMNDWAKSEGQPGLAYIFWRVGESGKVEAAGPVANALGVDRCELIARGMNGRPSEWIRVPEDNSEFNEKFPAEISKTYRDMCSDGLSAGDGVFFIAGVPRDMYKFSGNVRQKIALDLGLVDQDRFDFCWIVDFPMFEMNEETNHVDFSHNPFSMPQGELEALNTQNPLEILAYQYDIVCNGYELCSGAVRNHRPEIMLRAFEIAGWKAEDVEAEFAGMLNAFRYGAPPHGGLAPGIDRIVMLLAGQTAIREVIAFPLNQQGQDLMMNAPSAVREKQLKELSIRVAAPLKA